MIPEAKLVFVKNDKDFPSYIKENEDCVEIFDELYYKHDFFIEIEGKLIKPGGGKYYEAKTPSKNGTRYCVKYKNYFYKFEWFDESEENTRWSQNNLEYTNYKQIDIEDKKHFTKILHYNEGIVDVGDELKEKYINSFYQINFSYTVHKYEKLYDLKFKQKDYEKLEELCDKYELNDIIIVSHHNCSYKKEDGQLIPFIFDIAS